MRPGVDIGIVRESMERRATYARFIDPPRYYDRPAKEARISVDLRTGAKTVDIVPEPGKPIFLPQYGPPRPKLSRIYPWPVRRILEAVSLAFDVEIDMLISPRRQGRIVVARFACYRIMQRSLSWSTTRMGKAFGRDHTSIISGLKRARELHTHNTTWREKFDAAQALLESKDATS